MNAEMRMSTIESGEAIGRHALRVQERYRQGWGKFDGVPELRAPILRRSQ
jgi:hypothetical protein